MRNELRLPMFGRDWRIVRWSEVRPNEEILRSPLVSPDCLQRAVAESFAPGILAELHSESWGGRAIFGSELHHVCRRLEEGILSGTFVVVQPATGRVKAAAAAGGAAANPAAPPAADSPAPPKNTGSSPPPLKNLTWVAIRLVGANNVAAANEPYRVTLPNGKVNEGTLDSHGEAWFESVDPGNCQIAFPKLDAQEWHA